MPQNPLLHSYSQPDKNNIDTMFSVYVHIISVDLENWVGRAHAT